LFRSLAAASGRTSRGLAADINEATKFWRGVRRHVDEAGSGLGVDGKKFVTALGCNQSRDMKDDVGVLATFTKRCDVVERADHGIGGSVVKNSPCFRQVAYETDDLISAFQQCIDQMRPDKSGPTCDKGLHSCRSYIRSVL